MPSSKVIRHFYIESTSHPRLNLLCREGVLSICEDGNANSASFFI